MPRHPFCIALLACVVLVAARPLAAVPVNINSGNPRYPFPQFNDYPNGLATLASKNPVGVPHAELEQRVRDAWQIMANNITPVAPAEVLNGVTYLEQFGVGEPTPPNGVSEGDGYFLLAAAMMADKTVFDGLWLQVHDARMNNTVRYIDGVTCNPTYTAGTATLGWDNTNCTVQGGNTGPCNGATDGDEDTALALLMAWVQWGDNMGINGANGQPISYKNDALAVIRDLVAQIGDPATNSPELYFSGDIGFDGYLKSSNLQGELTTWANALPGNRPEQTGSSPLYFDYEAPAYYQGFAKFLAGQGDPPGGWNVTQYQRAAASGDWLVGQSRAKSSTSP